MLKVQHVSASGAKKRAKFTLPEAFDGRVSEGALYHAVRAFLTNRRQGTHSTKTRGEVAGGNQKPWKQKGTGRARQGTTRAAHWRGGGIVFGPKPRDYHVKLPRRVKRLAKQSALNARANDAALIVVDTLEFETPKTKNLLALLEKMDLQGKRVLILTAANAPALYLSGRNLQNVHVMEFDHASAFEVLWSDVVVVEQGALNGGAADEDGEDA